MVGLARARMAQKGERVLHVVGAHVHDQRDGRRRREQRTHVGDELRAGRRKRDAARAAAASGCRGCQLHELAVREPLRGVPPGGGLAADLRACGVAQALAVRRPQRRRWPRRRCRRRGSFWQSGRRRHARRRWQAADAADCRAAAAAAAQVVEAEVVRRADVRGRHHDLEAVLVLEEEVAAAHFAERLLKPLAAHVVALEHDEVGRRRWRQSVGRRMLHTKLLPRGSRL
eukprot:3999074-Prymnesium_polylepis.1